MALELLATSISSIPKKFYQVNDILADKLQGTGFRLAISQKLVEHCHEHSWVESEIG